MCGIFGAIQTNGKFDPDQRRQFRKLTDMVAYRGPDDSGYVCLGENSSVPEGSPFVCFLGHRRLSILDLSSAGRQPMTDGEGCWITFNGEIFNYVELRDELRGMGHRFQTGTDTEVVLRLYKHYGEAGFARMNGMWAFGLVDLSRGRVVLSRDRFSIKPLYLACIGGSICFASEIKQLVPLLDRVEPDLELMSAFLDQRLIHHGERTFYQGVRRLPPATNLVIDLNGRGCTETRYWNWQGAAQIKGDAVECFRELLVDSIRVRLRSDVRLGVLLSGGLDSSSIAVLTKLLAGEVDTYSVISDSEYSEEKYMDAVIARLGCRALKVRTTAKEAQDALHCALFHHDEPFSSFSMAAQFQMMRAIRSESDCKVLLSGQGADEVLLGYLKYFFFYLRELKCTRRYLKASGELLGAILQRTILNQFRLSNARRYMRSAATRDFLCRRGERVALWAGSSVRERQIADIEKFSVPALAHYEDRSAMAFGLEVRHPFLDHRLVQFAVNLPAELKIRGGWTKHVLRQAVPELPPAVGWRRDKQGFEVPDADWLRSDLAPMFERLFESSALEEMGMIDQSKFLTSFREFRAGSGRVGHNEFTRVLIAELWTRQFIRRDLAA
jgi:asparagine synthase (glutamine-hydrolysing)